MRFRILAALAIAGVVIVSCSSAEQDATAETPSGDAVDVAADFIQARDAWDSAAAVALLAPDPVLDDFADTTEDYPDQYEFLRATEFRTTLGECRQINAGEPAEVTCTYTYQSAWSQALEVGPYTGSSMDFVIADGLIQELDNNFDSSSGYSDDVWDVFNSWIRLNHFPDLMVIYTDGCCTPSWTPEAVALWERYTNEFVAEQGAESNQSSEAPLTSQLDAEASVDAWFDAYNAGNDEAVLGLFAPGVAISSSIGGNSTLDEWTMLLAWNTAQRSAWTPQECSANETEPGVSVTVTCSTGHRDALTQAVDSPPVPTNLIAVVTAEGISDLRFRYGTLDFTHVGGPFSVWMAANHPEIVEAGTVGFGNWATVEEARANGLLTAQYAAEWATYLTENGCTYLDGC